MYKGGFKGVLLTGPETEKHPNRDIFYLDITEDDDNDGVSAHISHHQTMNLPKGMRSTVPVNGLVCWYNGIHSIIYNVATRETMVLPVSVWDSEFCDYYLGYHPSDNIYKVLKTCPVYNRQSRDFRHYTNSEILTVGVDSSWRSIDPVPCHLRTFAYCKNGVLHWADQGKTEGHLLSFDLDQEKFQFFDIPFRWLSYSWLFGPNAVLASWYLRQPGTGYRKVTVLLYFEDLHHIRKGGQNSSIGPWTKHEIDASISEELQSFRPVSTLSNGKVIFIHNSAWAWNSLVPFYIYDQTERELKKCFISESNSSSVAAEHIVDTSRFENAFYYEENIIPLSYLGSGYCSQ
ncbi:OLC1v1019045C2 [Oldenlandia corymbosa var. corymbosa]|nr:OLC1v1019045C2 [Oldenlandia corymbosa var. corymbosa]